MRRLLHVFVSLLLPLTYGHNVSFFVPLTGVGNKRYWSAIAVAGLLAFKDCNEKNTDVVLDLKDRLANCSSNDFKLKVYDTQANAATALEEYLSSTTSLIIGAAFSSVAYPLSIVSGLQGVPSISYSATSPRLSDRLQGRSMFARTIPSDTSTVFALARLLQSLKLEHVALVYINDEYGTGYRDELINSCNELGITVHASGLQAGTEVGDSELSSIRALNLNVCILVIPELVDTLSSVLNYFSTNKMIGQGKLLIFSDGVSNGNLDAFLSSYSSPDILRGLNASIRVSAVGGLQRNPGFSRFVDKWKSMSESDLAYFNSFDGINVSPYFVEQTESFLRYFAPFAYDAMILGCISVCSQVSSVYDTIINTSFEGASGNVVIDKLTGSRSLGTGNFIAENLFFTPKITTTVSAVWLGSNWTTEPSLRFPPGDVLIPPVDVEFSENFNYLPPAAKITASALALVVIILCIVSAVWVYRRKLAAIVRKSQPNIVIIFLVGAAISTSSIFFMGYEDTEAASSGWKDFACMAVPWLWSVGTNVQFSALFCKQYRILLLFRNKKLRRKKIIDVDLYKGIIALGGPNLVIMIVWSIVSPWKYSRVVPSRDNFGNPLSSYGLCTSEWYEVFVVLLFSYMFLLFCIGVYTSYKVRNVDSDFQESYYITLSIVSQAQLYLFGIPIMLVFTPESSSGIFIMQFSLVFLNNALIVIVMVYPKWQRMRKNLNHAASELVTGGANFAESFDEGRISYTDRTLRAKIKATFTRQGSKNELQYKDADVQTVRMGGEPAGTPPLNDVEALQEI